MGVWHCYQVLTRRLFVIFIRCQYFSILVNSVKIFLRSPKQQFFDFGLLSVFYWSQICYEIQKVMALYNIVHKINVVLFCFVCILTMNRCLFCQFRIELNRGCLISIFRKILRLVLGLRIRYCSPILHLPHRFKKMNEIVLSGQGISSCYGRYSPQVYNFLGLSRRWIYRSHAPLWSCFIRFTLNNLLQSRAFHVIELNILLRFGFVVVG